MGHKFAEIAFTPAVRAVQEQLGSRYGYAKFDAGPDHHNVLSALEADFIAARDSFYMATVSETGWPYIQHRGGPEGFVRVIGDRTLALPDFRGNRQYVSVGNLRGDDRVSLFFMDYPNQRRLKMLGRVKLVGAEEDPELFAKLALDGYGAKVERAFVIHVEAFDWNCPQHITPRFTPAEIADAVQPLKSRIAELEAEVARLRSEARPGAGR